MTGAARSYPASRGLSLRRSGAMAGMWASGALRPRVLRHSGSGSDVSCMPGSHRRLIKGVYDVWCRSTDRRAAPWWGRGIYEQ
jgi:hypothetical protein